MIDIFSYIANNNHKGTVALLQKYNYKPSTNPEKNATVLRKIANQYKNTPYIEKFRHAICEIHPDTDFIVDCSVVPTFPSEEKKIEAHSLNAKTEEKSNCDGDCKCNGKANADATTTPSTTPVKENNETIIGISKQNLIMITAILAIGAIVVHFSNTKS